MAGESTCRPGEGQSAVRRKCLGNDVVGAPTRARGWRAARWPWGGSPRAPGRAPALARVGVRHAARARGPGATQRLPCVGANRDRLDPLRPRPSTGVRRDGAHRPRAVPRARARGARCHSVRDRGLHGARRSRAVRARGLASRSVRGAPPLPLRRPGDRGGRLRRRPRERPGDARLRGRAARADGLHAAPRARADARALLRADRRGASRRHLGAPGGARAAAAPPRRPSRPRPRALPRRRRRRRRRVLPRAPGVVQGARARDRGGGARGARDHRGRPRPRRRRARRVGGARSSRPRCDARTCAGCARPTSR